MKTILKTGIVALFFAVVFVAGVYAQSMHQTFDPANPDINYITVKSGIPIRYNFNGGVYKDWEGVSYTDYIEEKTGEDGTIGFYESYKPERDGYDFIGWTREKDVMNMDTFCYYDTVYEQQISRENILSIPPINIYAYWAKPESESGSHVINFIPKYGAKVEPLFLYTNADGKLPYYPIAEREGHRFKGWALLPDWHEEDYRVNENTVYEGDTKLYPLWEEKIKITFNPMGGVVYPTEVIIEKGSKIESLPVPMKIDNKFLYWVNDPGMYGYRITENHIPSFTGDKTLFARWTLAPGNWQFESEKWRYKIREELQRDRWIEISDAWYYFDKNANMYTGWLNQGGNWYYLSENINANLGEMLTGWQQIGGSWYYFYPNTLEGKPAGAMASDTSIDGFWIDSSGKWIP